jgi:hypothetical protein
VSATDRAGWVTDRTSSAFTIDSLAPTFRALTRNATHIVVTFSERVEGTVSADEWFVDGFPVESATVPAARKKAAAAIFTKIRLKTSGQPSPIGPNARPLVEYGPLGVDPTRAEIADRAGHNVPVDARSVHARDGIAPPAPTVKHHRELVGATRVTLRGSAQYGPDNEVVVRRVGVKPAKFRAPVDPNGAYRVTLSLVRNRVNRFRVRTADPSGNLSRAVKVRIDQDSARPKVRILDVKQRFGPAGLGVRILWASVEAHPRLARLWYRPDGAQDWRKIVARTKDDGSYLWQAPAGLQGHLVAIKVTVVDALGHRGSAQTSNFQLK